MVLLLVYWALNLPVLGQEIALLARQYPTHRNVTLRSSNPLEHWMRLPDMRMTRPGAAGRR